LARSSGSAFSGDPTHAPARAPASPWFHGFDANRYSSPPRQVQRSVDHQRSSPTTSLWNSFSRNVLPRSAPNRLRTPFSGTRQFGVRAEGLHTIMGRPPLRPLRSSRLAPPGHGSCGQSPQCAARLRRIPRSLADAVGCHGLLTFLAARAKSLQHAPACRSACASRQRPQGFLAESSPYGAAALRISRGESA